MSFSEQILTWYKKHQRELPWRSTSDPYKIWLSEIILQQTRINQGIGYYYKFLEHFPDVKSLADAPQDKVMGLWQGLGYYSRARNLHETAKIIAYNHQGEFPQSFKELLKLKGVGRYTAAAIASIAFNIPVAVVDGNVTRLLARFFGIKQPADRTEVKKQLEEIANNLIDREHPAFFNQAMMEMGALVCKPVNPDCQRCPLREQCVARINGWQHEIPVKEKKVKIKKRYFHFLLVYAENNREIVLLTEKRTGRDIWQNLYQLPLIESDSIELPASDHLIEAMKKTWKDFTPGQSVYHLKHILTHQRIFAWFYAIKATKTPLQHPRLNWISLEDFKEMGKPVLITRFLNSFFKD